MGSSVRFGSGQQAQEGTQLSSSQENSQCLPGELAAAMQGLHSTADQTIVEALSLTQCFNSELCWTNCSWHNLATRADEESA